MVLLLTEADVADLFSMEMALEAVEAAFRDLGTGAGFNRPRNRIRTSYGGLNEMAAWVPSEHAVGIKAYTASGGRGRVSGARGPRHVCLLYDDETGDLLAILEASKLGQMRTGAATGVATRVLAREDATTVGMIGTGRQARSQIAAVCAVRPITLVRAFSRDPERRAQFARETSEKLGVEVRPVASGEEAVRGADVVITMTNTKEPVLQGAWLEPGMHVNAAGQNQVDARELDVEAVRRANVIAADAVDGAKNESGDLVSAVEAGAISWDRVMDFGAILVGTAPGRTSAEQITLFESQGLCAEDMAGAARVYRCALEQGRGTEIPLFSGR